MISRQRMEVGTAEVLKAMAGRGDRDERFLQALESFGIGPVACLASSARVGLYHLFRMSGRRVAVLPAYNCRVVVEAARLAGLETRFVDIELGTYNMIEDQVMGLASPDSVVVATHQFGIPCDAAKLAMLAERAGSLLIEDCAAALGSKRGGVPVGGHGRAAVYSFEATKVLTLGNGGVITFIDEANRRRFLEQLDGSVHRQKSVVLATRVILDPLLTSPAVFPVVHRAFTMLKGTTTDDGVLDLSWRPSGLPTLASWQVRLGLRIADRLDTIIERRKKLAALYLRELEGVEGIELPVIPPDSDPVLIRFPIRVTALPKLEFYRACVAAGLDLAFSFSYSCDEDAERYPQSHTAASQVLDLPMYSKLDDDQAGSVVGTIRDVLGRK